MPMNYLTLSLSCTLIFISTTAKSYEKPITYSQTALSFAQDIHVFGFLFCSPMSSRFLPYSTALSSSPVVGLSFMNPFPTFGPSFASVLATSFSSTSNYQFWFWAPYLCSTLKRQGYRANMFLVRLSIQLPLFFFRGWYFMLPL